jgi:hypothetical protein
MRYDLSKIDITELFGPVSAATASAVRLDERISGSSLKEGWIDRAHFAEACASLWINGELVHLEDLVLHDAGMAVRAPTHELTVAHDILRTRRRIAANGAGWALSTAGLGALRSSRDDAAGQLETKAALTDLDLVSSEDDFDDPLAAIDAVLARSQALLADAVSVRSLKAPERDPLIYDEDWDEDARLAEWRVVLDEAEAMPPVLRAAVAWDAWSQLQVSKHAPWLGRLLASAVLRQAGLTEAQLSAVNFGLRQVSRERRMSRNRMVRLLSFVEAIALASELGLKEHQRLLLAKQQLERRLVGRRQSSRLPQLIELVLSRPLVSSGMIAEALGMTPQGALKIAAELGLRELTGRGRFRAWGIL